MPIDNSYLEFIEEKLTPLGEIRIKRMFGGAGIYCNDYFFAIIANETLYFKVDDLNRPDFESVDMGPFKPFDHKPTTMSYYEVPTDVLESSQTLLLWAKKAIEVAKKAHKPKKPKKVAKRRLK